MTIARGAGGGRSSPANPLTLFISTVSSISIVLPPHVTVGLLFLSPLRPPVGIISILSGTLHLEALRDGPRPLLRGR
ncbi:MAG: hypothetical protein HZB92_02860 [Euryarchaeota archaeon]|nr:hypothetical protein [Euryarchaeota archaeon]